MVQTNSMADQALTKQAADWVARLGGQPGEADWLAFEAWLGGDDQRRAAYDRVLTLSLALARDAEILGDEVAVRTPVRRGGSVLWGAGLMTVAAVAVTFAALNPRIEPKAVFYTTA